MPARTPHPRPRRVTSRQAENHRASEASPSDRRGPILRCQDARWKHRNQTGHKDVDEQGERSEPQGAQRRRNELLERRNPKFFLRLTADGFLPRRSQVAARGLKRVFFPILAPFRCFLKKYARRNTAVSVNHAKRPFF